MSVFTKSIVDFLLPSIILKKNVTPAIFLVPIRNYAARKGYREQRSKSIVKTDVKKSKFEIKKKEALPQKGASRKVDDSRKSLPIDNVYPHKYYKWNVYSFEEAVLGHRETHHPQMYNQPNAYLHVAVELNMVAEKKNKFLDNFTRVARIPHKFEHGEERSIVAFTKLSETVDELKNAGALQAGGIELIRQIQGGAISLQDFQYIVAHPNILPELTVLRGLMKKRFPNVKNGNLDVDLVNTVFKFRHGINYSAVKDEHENDFGIINARIGTLDMEVKQLEENFTELINDIQQHNPKAFGTFIRRTILCSPPSSEKLKVDHNPYLRPIEKQKHQLQEEELPEMTENERAVAV